MSGIIDTIYEIRCLLSKLEEGQGLGMGEVHELEALEATLKSDQEGRRYRRLDMRISAMLKRGEQHTLVQVLDLGPGGMRFKGGRKIQAGETLELHLREDEKVSYRFRAQASWVREQDDELTVGVRFIGNALRMNDGPPSENKPESIIDRIKIAQ